MLNLRTIHIQSLEELLKFLDKYSNPTKHIPIKKIAHALFKKKFTETVISYSYEDSLDIFKHYKSECEAYKIKPVGALVYHFFGVKFDIADLDKNISYYRGYCVLRPDGTISYAMLDEKVIIGEKDSYAYLVCKYPKTIEIMPAIKVPITGFQYTQKDMGIVMCSQSSFIGICEYWNEKTGINFTTNTAKEINLEAGIKETEMTQNSNRGLSIFEIFTFLTKQGVHYNHGYYLCDTCDSIKQKRIETNIYSYVESGFPVCCIVK